MSTSVISVRRIEPFLGVSRAPFLALPVALVALGTAAAARAGPVDPVRVAAALVGLLALHVAVNALNEASDYERGIDLETDPTPFSGGSGTLPAGDLDPASTRRFGLAAAGVGAAVGAWFLAVVGPVLLPLVAVGALCVLAYTDLLARTGLGEVAAGLGLGGLPVVGVALVQNGSVGTPALAAAVPASFLTFDLLLLNEFPDEEPDRRGGRLNLVHLLDRRGAALGYAVVAAGVPVSIVAAVAAGVLPPLALVGVLPSALLYRPVGWAVRRPAEPVPVDALRDNVAWILGTNLLLAAGIAFPAGAFGTVSAVPANEGLFLLARLLFGGVVALMAVNNLADLDGVAAQIGEKGVPYPAAAVVAASVPLLASAVAIALGVLVPVAAAYLVVFLLGATVVVHDFWAVEDPEEQENELFHFLKNLLILAAALLFLALSGADWPYAVESGLF